MSNEVFLDLFLPSDAPRFLFQLFGLFPAGIALGGIAWIVSILFTGVLRFFQPR